MDVKKDWWVRTVEFFMGEAYYEKKFARQLIAKAKERASRCPAPNGGLYIAFEGGDGAGKGTVIKKLQELFASFAESVVFVSEPKSTEAGAEIYEIIKSCRMDPLAELFIFSAARRQIWLKLIKPALEVGKIVFSDRSFASSMAYQGSAPAEYLLDGLCAVFGVL